jgi:probable rRNA maturation factor
MVDNNISSDKPTGTEAELEFEFVADEGATVPANLNLADGFTVYEAVLREVWDEEASSLNGIIGIILVGSPRIQELNREYLGKDQPTDVLSFDLSDDADSFEGEVYIGVDRAAAQAEDIGCSLAEEIARLMIHGVLHLAGHDHSETDDERRMLEATNIWIERWRVASGNPA